MAVSPPRTARDHQTHLGLGTRGWRTHSNVKANETEVDRQGSDFEGLILNDFDFWCYVIVGIFSCTPLLMAVLGATQIFDCDFFVLV